MCIKTSVKGGGTYFEEFCNYLLRCGLNIGGGFRGRIATMSLNSTVIDFIVKTDFKDLSKEALEATKKVFIDTTGVALASIHCNVK